MFDTKHFKGRMLYETEKVACINVYLNPEFAHNNPECLTQVLVSLVDKEQHYFDSKNILLHYAYYLHLDQDEVNRELSELVSMYRKVRTQLKLD